LSAVRNFILTALLSLLIFGLLAYGLVQFTTSAFSLGTDRNQDGETTNEAETGDPLGTDTPIVDPDDLINLKGESFTALLVGVDYQPDVYPDYEVREGELTPEGFPKEPRRVEADTVILLRVNKETGECVFCPIPATTQISVNGIPCQLQNLYAMENGIELLCTKVMTMTGLPIDYYAVIDIGSFATLIDELGGITYFVETDMYYVDESIGLTIDLRRGSQKLNGEKALKMLRYWSYADGDVSRRKCAVNFLKELFRKVLSQVKAEDAAMTYVKYAELFQTNFTLQDLSENVDLIFAYSKMTIVNYDYPGTTVGDGKDAPFTPNVQKAIEYFSKYKYKG